MLLMGRLAISMAMFSTYVEWPKGTVVFLVSFPSNSMVDLSMENPHWKSHGRSSKSHPMMNTWNGYPLGIESNIPLKMTIHSEFSHQKLWFSIVILAYQRLHMFHTLKIPLKIRPAWQMDIPPHFGASKRLENHRTTNPLVIKDGNGIHTIHRWFSYSNPHL